MAMKKRKAAHQRGSLKKKGKKTSKRKSPKNVQNVLQDQKCKKGDKKNICENESKLLRNPDISRISESRQCISQIERENVILNGCNCKNEDCCDYILHKDSKECISKSKPLQSSEMKEERNNILFTKVKNPEKAHCKLFSIPNQLDKYVNEKISPSGKDQLSKLKCLSKENLKSNNTYTRGDDHRHACSYSSDNLKDETDQWNSPHSHRNENKWKKSCNKKIENKIMNEVLSSKNIRIYAEAINIYVVDKIPRHPLRLGDIPWSWLREEKWRLHTFSRYPSDAPKSAILLAAEGFSYIGSGQDDSVICYFCETVKRKWHLLDDIPLVHEQLSPSCSFVTKNNCMNVPLETSFDDSIFCQLFKISVNNKGHNKGQAIQNKERPLGNNFEAPEMHILTDYTSPSQEASGINQNGSSQIETDGALPSLLIVGIGRNESTQISSSDISNTYLASQAVINLNITQQLNDIASTSSLQNSGTAAGQSTESSLSLQADSIVSHSATPSPQRPVTTAQSSTAAGQRSNTVRTTPSTTAQITTTQTASGANHNAGGPTYSALDIVTENPGTTAAQATALSSSLHANSVVSHSATPSPHRPVTTAQSSTAAGQSSSTVRTAPTTTAQTASGANQNAGGPTYSELGIVTERPKRFEYALLAKRMETFLSWPRDHHLRPKELSEAGFYYAGYGDCARCFYCGGGLRNWEDEDDVWVEHARWFPKCAYIRQQMGQVFVDTVQELNKTNVRIFFSMVMERIGHAASVFQLDSKDNPLKRDPAVKTILEMGYPLAEVIAVAETIKEDGNILSSDKIYEKLVAAKIKRNPNTINIIPTGTDGSEASHTDDIETMWALKEKNNQLRQQTTCKICMDKEVSVVFLPCGHFVSCMDCAVALKDCPVCRNHVKGIVRGFMG